jgi:hypothetical protein
MAKRLKDCNTKKDTKAYIKTKKDENGLTESVKFSDPEFYEDLLELIKSHPEYHNISKTIDFTIKTDIRNKRYLKITAVQSDGEHKDFSTDSCIDGISYKERLNSAMRYAVQPYIDIYKQNNPKICNNNECNGMCKQFEVDHYDKDFAEVKKLFLEKNKEYPKEFDENPITNEKMFKESDVEFKKMWIQFHNQNTNLRLLCKTCHDNKTYKRSKEDKCMIKLI